MTVIEKFASNLWVMSHYFTGLLAFLLFIFNFFNRKGSVLHRCSGRLYLAVYAIMLLLGLAAGILYEFYEDRSIKLMLWSLTYFTSLLLYHAWRSAADRRYDLRKNGPVRFLFFLFLPVSVLTAIFGLMKGQSVSAGLGLVLLLLTLKQLFLSRWYPELNNRIYQHASAMGLSGLFLVFNATGFFGIHAVMDAAGEVSWARSSASYGIFLFCLVLGEMYLFSRFQFLKRISGRSHAAGNSGGPSA